MAKKLGYSALLIICLAVAGYTALDHAFSDLYSKDAKTKLIVYKAPQDTSPPLPPYLGPHPSTQDRNTDPFDYPIKIGQVGPHQPLFSGPLQYPFLCGTQASGLGQPLVDNQDGIGMKVFATDPISNQLTNEIIGYSKDCLTPTTAFYYYHSSESGHFVRYDAAAMQNPDTPITQLTLNGKHIDFIVRVEMGTLNRFIYAIAALKGIHETPKGNLSKPDGSHWNKTLIYQFRGGVGIGKRQGVLGADSFLKRREDVLKEGYAVAFSTGNQTSNHYNMWIAEEVMMRVKNQFTALYGEPKHTIGIGGSGGAIQQLLIAQNHPGLLDGALALYSYPDMVTQIPYAYDCELLEYYFDVTAKDNDKWQRWKNRVPVQGLNAEPNHTNEFSTYYNLARLIHGVWPPVASGMSECSNAWRGLTQLTNNPHFTHLAKHYSEEVLAETHWTHWDDLKHLYGTRPSGYANQAWDNVGVQYGLNALKANEITTDEFLHLNHSVGGWKPPEAIQQERLWQLTPNTYLFEFSPWSHHNQWLPANDELPALRTRANPDAISASYHSGHVFIGKINTPILDVRHYLEDELDMHHVSASMSIRQRLIDYQGHADQHVIWVTRKPHTPILEAIESLTNWVDRQHASPDHSAATSRPETLQDTCFDDKGVVIAKNTIANKTAQETDTSDRVRDGVWDGPWNQKPLGACSQHYPIYQNSRIVSGDDWRGDTMKCALQTVDQALKNGTYGTINMQPYRDRLRKIFPDGVCDFKATAKAKAKLWQNL